MKNEKKELTLKTALNKLDLLVTELNSNNLDLEDGLDKFKEGVDIIKFCREQITKAENTFKTLSQDLDKNKEEKNSGALI